MKKQRLLKLADLMDTIADGKKRKKENLPIFCMPVFGAVREGDKPLSCRTQACALGSAAISGIFKRQGLSFTLDGNDINVTLKQKIGPPVQNFEAAVELFDLSHSEVFALFSDSALYDENRPLPDGVRGARKVAKVIREFVARGGLPKWDAEAARYVR